ncbi:signal peptidase I [Planococcus sp. N028]|uniref:Signal peptidase I n=1 Tax=Planococcus shixiaomingii TaxID=3058393 RepID=A0ABT8N2C3_9BACL|nr:MULTISPECIES: signal peptidase I [unclassified Planococcus (in: firmicutes)]MDN7242041.1 signal peptidase I [Planococcus sp. N028]WKA54317.1 signal peptidase I [Planococcus sp. N022]
MYGNPIKLLISWMKVIFLTAVIVVATRQFLFEPVAVHGKSMMPTIEEDDKIILTKISHIKNFDLVVFMAPNGKNLIKRVIGTPGDRIAMKEDQLFLNGQPVDEPYLKENLKSAKQQGYVRLTNDFPEIVVPSGCYYVLGDNRLNSVDSRVLGYILEEAVIGEAKFRIAPAKHVGIIK